MEDVIVAWSGGKDSARALFELSKDPTKRIKGIFTTVNEDYDRVCMHGVRYSLLEAQADAMRLPLATIKLQGKVSNEDYELKMKDFLLNEIKHGVYYVAFGDIFLEDLKKYREENLAKIDMKGLFPIWKRDSAELAKEFISSGFKAILTCVDTKVLDGTFSGREYDHCLLSELPGNIDPCGENGEFHTFVYDGPIFSKRIRFIPGQKVLREERFMFCDLIPG